MKIQRVQSTENPKVGTFELDADILGIYSKIAIPLNSKLIAYSPLAQMLFAKGTDVNRIDFVNSVGNTRISLAKKFLPWSSQQLDLATAELGSFFQGKEPALYVQSLQQSIAAHRSFEPGNNPVMKMVQKSFHDQVNPRLAEDGGAMELINVELKSTGQIFADVALIGSCNGCAKSTDSTLKGATEKIREVLSFLKQKHSGNPNVQALSFEEIRIKEMPELILTRK